MAKIYANQWIAVLDQRIVAVADSFDDLFAEVETKSLPVDKVTKHFVRERPVHFIL